MPGYKLVGVAVVGCVLLAGCEVYEMQSATEGEVYVLNKYTGTLQRSFNGRLNAVAEAPSVIDGNCTVAYGNLGVRFSAYYRAMGTRVYYRLRIEPSAPAGRTISVENWISYFQDIRDSGAANFLLLTADGFQLANAQVTFDKTTGIVDSDGKRDSFESQGSTTLPDDAVRQIDDCLIGYNGLFPIPARYLDPVSGDGGEAAN